MNPFVGALGGAVVGGIGDFFSSRSRRKAMERFRIRQQQGITEARRITEERVQSLLDNPLIKQASTFIEESFAGDGGPLADQLAKRLRVAQESRGLRRSTAGAVAEASSLAAFRQNFLANLLPQAQSFGTLGERFRQNILQSELPINIAFQTGAAIPGVSNFMPIPGAGDDLLAGITGAIGGGGAGFQFGSEFARIEQQNQFLSELEGLRRSNAGGFGGSGGLGGALGGSLF